MSPTISEYKYVCKKCKTEYSHPWHHYCDMCQNEEFAKIDKDGQVVFDFPTSPSAIFDEDKNE